MKISVLDVAYFVAELVVYASVAWWAATRPIPLAGRVGLAVGLVLGLAVTWGVFAAPQATIGLTGAAGTVFRLMWFGVGAAALISVLFTLPA